ncbi:hypothetical protein TcasGA2_TC010544 [Tribolium castaneum]|uniref:Uncharacterized protein n=1 Tax=Tribolium castaneum TaxID=7070 RepID=D6WE09_TRICA|nr:hypothetical protein TcasGA2_TC010544 [Tribolium castaneum]
MMESLEEVAAREEAERQQSLRDLEQLYEWLQQFEDPPPTPRPPPPHQFRNDRGYKAWSRNRMQQQLLVHLLSVG